MRHSFFKHKCGSGDGIVADESRVAVHHIDIQRAQFVMAIGAAGGGHGVGDERDAVRCQFEGKPQHGILYMEPIGDELDGDAAVFHNRGNRAGFAVVEAVHCVEHVCHQASAGVDGLARHGIVGVTVADGGHHAGGSEHADGFHAMGPFGCDGDLPH